MAASSLNISLYLSYALTIAPGWLLDSLNSVEITRNDTAPYGFQLSFTAERDGTVSPDYPILSSGLLDVGTRVAVTTTVFGASSVVADGFITHQELTPATPTQDAQLVITCEDVSVQMALYEYSLEYPFAPDAAIAGIVLAKWLTLGIIPEIIPTPTAFVTFTNVPQQVGNDRAYLVRLAAQHGYVFYIKPGPSLGENIAYWGPPPRTGAPQPALTIDAGGETTVEEIRFNYDALAPRLIYGLVEDPYLDTTLPVITAAATRFPLLSERPVLPLNAPFIRTTLFQHQGLSTVQAYAKAQAMTNRSTDATVVAEGSLDVLRYGAVLEAPGVVAVRGAGADYDGLFYVRETTHQISRQGYRQHFKLAREGLGSTIARVAG